MNRPQRFWMVAGGGPTLARHGSLMAAELEARRLARKAPGEVFYVMEATIAVVKVDIERIDLRESDPDFDEVPF